ncbi:hypothetical protein NP493_860g00020 [Ridgeia piscesae]|uniref:Uncharacterized protein n=1 Tax=Ridgeia piscesae TaxID=27915 RepID=A0AAD9KND7_RIDPI|nr:hypothetical protein NP493_860g00020 [Ridgeia piscesae]
MFTVNIFDDDCDGTPLSEQLKRTSYEDIISLSNMLAEISLKSVEVNCCSLKWVSLREHSNSPPGPESRSRTVRWATNVPSSANSDICTCPFCVSSLFILITGALSLRSKTLTMTLAMTGMELVPRSLAVTVSKWTASVSWSRIPIT